MTGGRSLSRFAWLLVVLTIALFVAGWAFGGAAQQHAKAPADFALVMSSRWLQLTPLFALSFVIVGALIVSRRPGNLVGWVCAGIGILSALYTFAGGYVFFGRYAFPGTIPAVGVAQWLLNWEWVLPVVLTLFFLPFLFPDGKPISPRWWPLAAFALLDVGLALLPIGRAAATFAGLVGTTAGLIADIGAVVSLVIRYRRSRGDERQQIRWFFAAAIVLMVVAVAGALDSILVYHSPTVVFIPIFDVLIPLALTGLAISIGVSVLRYHLYDIDILLRQTLVYGALVFLIGILYFILIVSVAQRFGALNARDPAVPAVFAAIIAIAFQPVRARLQRLANRLVYGKRATPYEVLSQFSKRMSAMYAGDDLPRQMARVLAEGVDADLTTVWLHVGSELRVAASWPAATIPPVAKVPLQDGALPPIIGVGDLAAVRYQGELLGALAVHKREPLTPVERRLLDDLAHEAGLVFKNARLNAELLQRLDELQASRQRLVAAQDSERRRLERNIHDGAQQNLVALKIKLGVALNLAARDPAQTQALLHELSEQADDALETLRELARGIYPPILSDRGLTAALIAHVNRAPLPVEVKASGLPRYPQELEAAVYFCCLEAVQNVIKHASATRAVITLEPDAGTLTFAVDDDGRGIDPAAAAAGSGMQNMADRLSALGGSLTIGRSPLGGARITGRLPAGRPTTSAASADLASPSIRAASSD